MFTYDKNDFELIEEYTGEVIRVVQSSDPDKYLYGDGLMGDHKFILRKPDGEEELFNHPGKPFVERGQSIGVFSLLNKTNNQSNRIYLHNKTTGDFNYDTEKEIIDKYTVKSNIAKGVLKLVFYWAVAIAAFLFLDKQGIAAFDSGNQTLVWIGVPFIQVSAYFYGLFIKERNFIALLRGDCERLNLPVKY